MANQENLKSWPKGTSGNPSGRPKGQTVRGALKVHLAQADPNATEQTRRETAARKLWDKSENDPEFLLDLLRWLEGPSPKESSAEDDPDDPPATDEHGTTIEP